MKASKALANDSRPKKLGRRGRKPKPMQPYEGPGLAIGNDKVREVPLHTLNIEDETFQIRFSSRPDKSLSDSIASIGIQVPLIVRPHPTRDGEFQIVCGFRRANGAMISEIEKVPVLIRALADEEAQIVAFTENECRKTLKDIDRARAMERLRRAGKTTAQIASLFRLSDRQVQRIEGLLDYPALLREALDKEELTTTYAIVLCQAEHKHGNLFHLSEWIDIAKSLESIEELKREINRRFGPQRQKGVLIHRSNGKVSFNLHELEAASREHRDAALEELEQILSRLR